MRKSKSTKGNMIIVENDECDDQQVLFKLDHAEVAASFDGTTCWAKVGEKLERTSTSSRAQKAKHSTPVPCVFDLKTVEKK